MKPDKEELMELLRRLEFEGDTEVYPVLKHLLVLLIEASDGS